MSSPKYHNHASDEWLTPNHIIEAVRLTMGMIELDPCSNSATHPNVPARYHFTPEENGLEEEWFGTVFQNHPYSKATAWVEKALLELEEGRVEEVIILDAARPDTRRFHMLAGFPVAFHLRRIKFIDGRTGLEAPNPTFPSALFYLRLDHTPADYARFHKAFSPFCSVYRGADL